MPTTTTCAADFRNVHSFAVKAYRPLLSIESEQNTNWVFAQAGSKSSGITPSIDGKGFVTIKLRLEPHTVAKCFVLLRFYFAN